MNSGNFFNSLRNALSKNKRDKFVYLVSFPKSGNTWVRFLLGNYLTNGRINFSNYHKVIPDIHRNPEDIPKVKYNPTIIKSHFTFNTKYKKVIYIYRDGRDVSVSYYHHLKGKDRIPKDLTFEDFFWNYFFKGKTVVGDWGKHILSWQQKTDDIIFVRYEQLQRNTYSEMCKILKFCDILLDEEKLIKSIALSSKENMASDELENKANSIEHKDAIDGEFKFIRKGIIGDWRDYYNEEMTHAFKAKYKEVMYRLEYK